MMGIGITELMLLILFSVGGQVGLPLGIPPGPEDPVMFQFAPDDCVFYTSWASTVAPDPEGNITERWMASPEIQEAFNNLKTAIKELSSSGSAEDQAFGELAFQIAERCTTNACGFYVGEVEAGPRSIKVHGGLLIHLGDDADELIGKLSPMVVAQFAAGSTSMDISGVSCQKVQVQMSPDQPTDLAWGVVNGMYLAVALGEGEMERLLANMKTDEPEWLGDLKNEISVDRPSAVSWINIKSVFDTIRAEAPREEFDRFMDVSGFGNLTDMGWVAGLDDQGFICRGAIHLDGEPTGVLAVFGQEPLEPELFGKIASDRMVVTGMRVSAPKIFSLIRHVIDMNEWSRGSFDQAVDALNNMIDIDLEEDVIDVLDDYAYVYGSVNFTNPTAGWVLGFGASNEMDLTDTYNKVNEFIKSQAEAAGDRMKFEESEVNDITIFGLKDTRGWGMPNFSWTLADGELLISMDKSSLRRHLRRKSMAADAMANDPWFKENAFSPMRMDAEGPLMVASLDIASALKIGMPLLTTFGGEMGPPNFNYSLDDLPSVSALTKDMKPGVSAVYRTPEGFETVQRQTFPGGTPGTLLGTTAIGLIPATLQVRKAAMRTSSANNMRQLILAMHNYHDSNGAFPARFSKNGDDEPLLSWRVHILPFMEEQPLYDQFHLDEPWDSEHNKTLIDQMPQIYVHPMIATEEGKTVFVVPSGEGTAMSAPTDADEKPKGVRLEDIPDGTSRTAVILEANNENAVVWTQPEDFDWANMEDPVDALFKGWDGDGVNVVLADGSVQFISFETLREIFEPLVKTSDGEVVLLHDR